MATVFKKDADALLDYKVNWSDWLNGQDNIVSAAAFIDSSTSAAVSAMRIATDAVSANGQSHVIWLSAGVEGAEYKITSRIWTSAGRRNDDSFLVRIEMQ